MAIKKIITTKERVIFTLIILTIIIVISIIIHNPWSKPKDYIVKEQWDTNIYGTYLVQRCFAVCLNATNYINATMCSDYCTLPIIKIYKNSICKSSVKTYSIPNETPAYPIIYLGETLNCTGELTRLTG